MKKILAILVVALLATSISFAQTVGTGTGTVKVTVEYMPIYVDAPAAFATNIFVGQSKTGNQMTFYFSGSSGIAWTQIGATATTWDNPGVTLSNGSWDKTNGVFTADFGSAAGILWDGSTYTFDLAVANGTTSGLYTGTFKVTVDY